MFVVMATVRDYTDQYLVYRLVKQSGCYRVEEYREDISVNEVPCKVNHSFGIEEDDEGAYQAAMTVFIKCISEMATSILPPAKTPEGFRLVLYTEEPDHVDPFDDNPDKILSVGSSAKECMGHIAKVVDAANVWDFDSLYKLSLAHSVIALGDNPEGVVEVWVELVIY